VSEVSDATLYYDDGKVEAKGKYIDKNKDSVWTYYDAHGKMTATESYANGAKDGVWKIYYGNGKVSEEAATRIM